MNSTVDDKINPYEDVTTEELHARITELSDELRGLRVELKHRQTSLAREAWENLQEAQANYRNVTGGSTVSRIYSIPRSPFGLINGRF
jgi:ABC-type phosphate transport system auxiliary subunit